jgi:hypothetical protein
VGLIQVVAAILLVLGSYLVVQVAFTDRFDERRRTCRRDPQAGDGRPTWRRAA